MIAYRNYQLYQLYEEHPHLVVNLNSRHKYELQNIVVSNIYGPMPYGIYYLLIIVNNKMFLFLRN